MNGLQEKFLHGYQPLRLRSGRCGFRTAPVFSKKLPKYLFNLHLRCAIEMQGYSVLKVVGTLRGFSVTGVTIAFYMFFLHISKLKLNMKPKTG